MKKKTWKKMENRLPYPYSEALERGNSIDYRVGYWSKENDHDYVEKLGYEPHMAADCTYYAHQLPGLSLSSYGNWGTYFPDFSDENTRGVFLDMYEKGIIKLWRITAYIKINGSVTCFSYEEGSGWRTYDPEHGWSDYNGDPYKDFPE